MLIKNIKINFILYNNSSFLSLATQLAKACGALVDNQCIRDMPLKRHTP
jgi:hypothetical protein